MRFMHTLVTGAMVLVISMSSKAKAADICKGFGPQAPRDISSPSGSNARLFTMAPSPEKMNLCNIHFHTNAEHKGPGFSVSTGGEKHSGFKCNATPKLTAIELIDPSHGDGACHGVKPGDTIEVHWVHTSCNVKPGEGLGSCLSDKCANPQLRVETQVFLVVNDSQATDFSSFAYGGNMIKGLHQAKSLPSGTGDPVVFTGSTTGPKYSEEKCSPMQATWSVRPSCAKINIASLNTWCASNIFNENHAHGVRQLVTNPKLLSPIK
jgi:hypothetical protein